jgi:hypothetical protein
MKNSCEPSVSDGRHELSTYFIDSGTQKKFVAMSGEKQVPRFAREDTAEAGFQKQRLASGGLPGEA